MNKLASRQVHLDFHTSEFISGVGAKFDATQFQDALRAGHVNSITIFAKCHHSWSYYPTKAGRMHPTLDFDLTGAMMNAAHEIGVKAPVYLTVGWSAGDAADLPECVARQQDGRIQMIGGEPDASPSDKRPIVSWKFMCPSGNYADLIYAQTREVCERYPELDGLFYDICFQPLGCWCANCLAGMEEQGLNPAVEQDARSYHTLKWMRFTSTCTAILREFHPDASIFFNGGAELSHKEWHGVHTHIEMEDLPTTWGGYDKMPVRAKYFAALGRQYLGMTGKFHTMWGEFGGFKSPEALRYEIASMMMYGARCSIGDQMHPSGLMDMETYRTIGEAYRYAEQIEEWCFEVEETATLGVILSNQSEADEGLTKMLLECQLDFDIADLEQGLDRFETLILPDSVALSEESALQIQSYVDRGGSLLLTGASGLNPGKTHFQIDVGAAYQGPSLYENDYVLAGEQLKAGIVSSPFLFYEGAEQVSVKDAEVLATIHEPYFNRTYGHYCSHQNTPYRLEPADYPAAIRKGNIIYAAHSICTMYFRHGAKYHRDYLMNALNLVYRKPVMKVNLPSCGRARFVYQPSRKRYILHLTYAAPIQRGRTSVIEDMPPIYDVAVELTVKSRVQRATLILQGESIPFVQSGDTVKLTIPKVHGHQMVILDVQDIQFEA